MASETNTQIGILFGFVAVFLVVITSYCVMWRVYNKREEQKEAERKAGLIERGFGTREEIGEKESAKDVYEDQGGYPNTEERGVGAAGAVRPGTGACGADAGHA